MGTLPLDKPAAATAKQTMQALVYLGPGQKALQERPIPEIAAATDAIVRVRKTTICGSDLRILDGDVPTCAPGRILGHEGVGTVASVGTGVIGFHVGDRVMISCISACAQCDYCRKGLYSRCATGGWILGNEIDGTQAEYVRIPYADTSLYAIPDGVDEEALVMLSDVLPTGFECGVVGGKIQPDATVAIAGAGPLGLAVLLTARFHSPAQIISIDNDNHRLGVATRLGATHTINGSAGSAAEELMAYTDGRGVDTAIETTGTPDMLLFCRDIVVPGGTIAAVGMHGVDTGAQSVDTVSAPMLLRAIQTKEIDPTQLISHHFRLRRVEDAYDMFARSAKTQALKIIISA
jgi:alcohol dehydrogenase